MNAPVKTPSLTHIHVEPPSTGAFRVVPLLSLQPDQVQYYFQTLYSHGTLKFRFPDIIDPTWSDVIGVIQRMGQGMYLIQRQADESVAAEFTLENFTGRAAQSHFSTSPESTTKERIAVGRYAAQFTLTRRNELGEYWLDALYGLTPLSNRAACIFAIKIGYKRQGILPSGLMVDGKPEDCMISVRTRDEDGN